MPTYECLINGCGKDGLNSVRGCKCHASRMHNVKKDDFDLAKMFKAVPGSEDVVPEHEGVPDSPVAELAAPVLTPTSPVQATAPSQYAMIPPGSVIIMDTSNTGMVWRQDKAADGSWTWTEEDIRGVEMRVLDRQPSRGEWMLFCRPNGATTQWAVLEKYLLNGQMRVVSVPEGTPLLDLSEFAPEPNVAAVDPDVEREEELSKLRPIIKEYAEKSHTACVAQKAFDKLKKVVREDVLAAVQGYGILNEDEKSNSAESRILWEGGYKLEAYRTNDQEVDEWSPELAGYLAANAKENPSYQSAIYTAVDYKALKKLVDDGFFPPEMIAQFCKKRIVEGQWRLRVDVDDTQK